MNSPSRRNVYVANVSNSASIFKDRLRTPFASPISSPRQRTEATASSSGEPPFSSNARQDVVTLMIAGNDRSTETTDHRDRQSDGGDARDGY